MYSVTALIINYIFIRCLLLYLLNVYEFAWNTSTHVLQTISVKLIQEGRTGGISGTVHEPKNSESPITDIKI